MTVRRAVLVLVTLLSLGLAGCGASSSGSTTTTPTTTNMNMIVIKNFAFSPMTLTVAPGAKVSVKNEDAATHTLSATTKSFDTGDITQGAIRTFTAPTTPGTYTYICNIHQYMQGTLTVK